MLNAEVAPGLNDTVAWFEWGPTISYGNTTAVISLPRTTSSVPVSAVLTNLTPFAFNYFRAVGSNALGTVFGNMIGFQAVPRLVEVEGPARQVNWTSIACSRNGASVLACAHNWYWDLQTGGPITLQGSLVYMSTNFGLSWKSLPAPNTNWGRVAMSADGKKLFAGAGVTVGDRNLTGPIYSSRDSGSTWQQVGESRLWKGLACSADGSTLLACSDLVFRSQDSGDTWHQTSLPSGPWTCVTISSDGQKMAASNWSGGWRDAGTIWTSINAGETWKPADSIQAITLVSSGDGSKLLANAGGAGQFLNAAVSTNWGLTWARINLYGAACPATTYDGKKWFAQAGTSYNAMACSDDGGVTWGLSDDNDLTALAIACSSNGASVYVLRYEGLRMWQESSARLSMTIETNMTISWPSYHLSSQLQQNPTLNSNGWVDLNQQPMLTNRIFKYVPRSPGDNAFYRLKTP
jgi:hypothetical protein